MKIDVDARQKLKAAIKAAGSQRALAAEIGVSQQYINDLMQGKCRFSDKILEKLGLRRIIVTR